MIPICLKIKLKWFPLVKFRVGHLRSLLPFQPNAYFTSQRNTEKFLFWITMHAVRRDCLWLVAGFRCAVSDWSIGFKGGSGGVRLSQALLSALRVRGSIHSLFYYCLRCDSTLAGISPAWQVTDFTRTPRRPVFQIQEDTAAAANAFYHDCGINNGFVCCNGRFRDGR